MRVGDGVVMGVGLHKCSKINTIALCWIYFTYMQAACVTFNSSKWLLIRSWQFINISGPVNKRQRARVELCGHVSRFQWPAFTHGGFELWNANGMLLHFWRGEAFYRGMPSVVYGVQSLRCHCPTKLPSIFWLTNWQMWPAEGNFEVFQSSFKTQTIQSALFGVFKLHSFSHRFWT